MKSKILKLLSATLLSLQIGAFATVIENGLFGKVEVISHKPSIERYNVQSFRHTNENGHISFVDLLLDNCAEKPCDVVRPLLDEGRSCLQRRAMTNRGNFIFTTIS